jgi:protein SCO1/2
MSRAATATICLAALLLLAGIQAQSMPTRASAAETVAAETPATASTPDPLAGRFGGPFSLLAAEGRAVSDRDFRGRFMLVYFGYTHCPDVCPLDLSVMAEALALLGPAAAEVEPIFITVDPARDTPALMAEYAKSFSPRITALSGTEADIAAVAKAYKVHRRKVPAASPGRPDDYVVDHGSLTYLMGPDGAFRTLIPHNTPAERMATIVAGHVRQAALVR